MTDILPLLLPLVGSLFEETKGKIYEISGIDPETVDTYTCLINYPNSHHEEIYVPDRLYIRVDTEGKITEIAFC